MRRAGAEKNTSFPDNVDDAAYVDWLGGTRNSPLIVERAAIVAHNLARLIKFEKKAAIIEANYTRSGSAALVQVALGGGDELSAAERRSRNRLSLAGLAIVRGESLVTPTLKQQPITACRLVVVVSAVYPFMNLLLPNNESLPTEEVTLQTT